MDVEVTEPTPTVTARAEQIRGQLTPSRIVAGISTTVAVVAVAALIGVTTKRPETAPAENTGPAVAASSPAAPAPAPALAPAPAKPVAAHSVAPNLEALLPTSPSASAPKPVAAATPAIDSGGGLADIFAVPTVPPAKVVSPAPPVPAVSAAPAAVPPASAAAPAWPALDFGLGPVNPAWQSAVAAANAQPGIDALISAVTGTTGWVGNGALNVLANFLIAWDNQNRQNPWGNPAVPPADGLSALMLGPAVAAGANLPAVDWTKVPPPQLPPIDWTKIPPPQLPPIDWTKIPPPQLPHFEDPFAKLPSITRAIGLPF
ncbi:hypothetical protein A5733_14470 [Mycobacterium sp. NS-7484]|uniref:hypothetical protein n=1 Tax=Mycobacterium sp. NS-7484 TaxID=1834161 RepID=UPI00096C1FE8|nr:hypothetical protein [Mycobacterium sp. NS-7484]OMB94376.1 hypothetical protein A5733_14470 [Mycobacterium sp. NS-7484]